MRISSYYLKWIIAMGAIYALLLVLSQRDTMQQGVLGELLMKPLADMIELEMWFRIVAAVAMSSVVVGLLYGWIAQKLIRSWKKHHAKEH